MLSAGNIFHLLLLPCGLEIRIWVHQSGLLGGAPGGSLLQLQHKLGHGVWLPRSGANHLQIPHETIAGGLRGVYSQDAQKSVDCSLAVTTETSWSLKCSKFLSLAQLETTELMYSTAYPYPFWIKHRVG